jgi:hypothetical protein
MEHLKPCTTHWNGSAICGSRPLNNYGYPPGRQLELNLEFFGSEIFKNSKILSIYNFLDHIQFSLEEGLNVDMKYKIKFQILLVQLIIQTSNLWKKF